MDENSFQPLQTSSSAAYTYNKIDFNRSENIDKSMSRVSIIIGTEIFRYKIYLKY